MRLDRRIKEKVLIGSNKDASRWEDAELKTMEDREDMPTTFDKFKNNPKYALERHVKKYEMIYSKVPVVGHFKGEPIYKRENVRPLHTKEAWLKEGRAIKVFLFIYLCLGAFATIHCCACRASSSQSSMSSRSNGRRQRVRRDTTSAMRRTSLTSKRCRRASKLHCLASGRQSAIVQRLLKM